MNKFLQSVYREFSDKGEINGEKKKKRLQMTCLALVPITVALRDLR